VKLIIRHLVWTFQMRELLSPFIIRLSGVEVRHSDLFLGIISTSKFSTTPNFHAEAAFVILYI
jgi:hypothetical protein